MSNYRGPVIPSILPKGVHLKRRTFQASRQFVNQAFGTTTQDIKNYNKPNKLKKSLRQSDRLAAIARTFLYNS